MKVLVIGGNRFVGLRFTHWLSQQKKIDLSIVNRTGQAPHAQGAAVYKADRANWLHSGVDKDWDAIIDFAGYKQEDAEGSLEYFKRVGRYTFISTISIYKPAANLSEQQFDPLTWDLSVPPVTNDYQEGKRRAEAVFAQRAPFPTAFVRFPLILGPDDYTRRLNIHVERIETGQPIYFPNIDARVSMIHSADASRFLEWNLSQTFAGAINAAAAEPLRLKELIERIEKNIGRRAVITSQETEENHSPYGWAGDTFQNVDKAKQLGFTARPIKDWIGDLIEGARSSSSPASRMH